MAITKHHYDIKTNKEMNINQIFQAQVGYGLSAKEFEFNNVYLLDNSPEEIENAVIEFDDYINLNFTLSVEELLLQNIFKSKFVSAKNSSGMKLHGEFRAVFSNTYLMSNKFLIE